MDGWDVPILRRGFSRYPYRVKTRIRGSVLLAVVVSAVGIGAALSSAQDEVQWLDSYKEALREAKRVIR